MISRSLPVHAKDFSPSSLYRLFKFKEPFITQWKVIRAGIIIAMIPTLIAFLALQKYVYSGLTRGAIR